MTCGGCTSAVTKALKAVSGVDDVDVSLPTGDVTVRYDERRTSPDQLRSAMTGAGYGMDVSKTATVRPAKGGCCS
jgi:copper chaperone